MADKERKHFSELTYRELDRDVLTEHAESLDDETALAAIDYLAELDERILPTKEMLDEYRAALKAKTKIVNIAKTIIDETTGKEIEIEIPLDTKTPLYTDAQIEKRLAKKKKTKVQKHDNFTQKLMYCEKYWPDIVPQKKKSDAPTYADNLAAAKARIKARREK
jgi:head-tail adaptor